jgi:hypothetical protein
MTDKEKHEILDWIRAEHEAGRALNIHAVKRRHPDLLAAVYSARPFWGWWQAIADAGLNYEDLKVELEEKVACRICGYEGLQLNTHLSARHGIKTSDYRAQFPDAEISSEWRRARMRREGGKNLLPHWEPLYSDEYMMDRAYRYHRMGHRLRTTWVAEHDHNLWQYVHRQGITWESFVTALGIPYTHDLPPRAPRMTRETLLDGLRQVVQEEGSTPTMTRLSKLNHSLMTGVQRHFGSYDEALEAAGLPLLHRPFPLRRVFSPDAVLAELRQLTADGHRITEISLRRKLGLHDLHYSIIHMGGYPAIREKLGIAKPPPPPFVPRHTREEVIEAFQKQAAEGEAYTIRGMNRGSDGDRALLSSVRHHFKKWPDLLDAAGLVPEHHAIARARDRRAALLEKLQRRHAAGESLDHRKMRKHEDSRKLYLASRQAFGSWGEALTAAGLPSELIGKKAEMKEQILAEIREFHQSEHPLESRAMKSTPTGLDLYRRAKSTFTSWKKAVLTAGLEWPVPGIKKDKPRKPKMRTTPLKRDLRRKEREQREQAVIEAIRERQRSRKTLRLRKIRWEAEGKELYDNARRVFTSWKAALKAAGCKPETRPPRKISKIVRELELAYPIDPSTWESESSDDLTKPKSDVPGMPLRGWRQSGKGEKQRTTLSRAKRRKKRK